MNAMALTIRIASWVAMAVPVVIGGWVGRRWLKGRLGLNVGMLVGSVLGVGLDLWFFHESISQPTPVLQIHAPSDFAHESVILIEDPRSNNEVAWSGGRGELAVPRSGVVRLKTLGLLYGHLIQAQLNGQDYYHFGSMTVEGAPLATFNFAYYAKEPALDLMSTEALAAYIRDRESER
jgi:hypothetical protein